MLEVIDAVDVKVIELCFNDRNKALEVGGKVVKEHPEAVCAVFTSSDMRGNTSVLHIHVRSERLYDLLDRPHIKGSGGTMLVSTTSPLAVSV